MSGDLSLKIHRSGYNPSHLTSPLKAIQILITHTPPYGVLDLTRRGINAGCESLLERMVKLKDLRLHVFGHIHEAAGHTTLTGPNERAIAVNAATPHGRLPIHVIDLRQ
jgi:Icc-related predicted phosphoesterase